MSFASIRCTNFQFESTDGLHIAYSRWDADPVCLHQIRSDLPVYLFSGSEDPVSQQLERLRVLIERYRSVGVRGISSISTVADDTKMLHEINVAEVQRNLLQWISAVLDKEQTWRNSVSVNCLSPAARES